MRKRDAAFCLLLLPVFMTQAVYGQRKKGPKPNTLARKNDFRDTVCFIDVVFILDSSESSKIVLFDNQKAFVDSLSERLFQLTPGRSLKYDIKLAALQFSSSIQIDPPLSSWKDLRTFKQRVKSLSLIGQGTFSYYAISNATKLLKREGRKDGVKVALLMTDGIDHPKSPDVQSISEDARISGISFITVGLSTVVNEAKLRLISGDASSEPVLLLSDPTLVDKIQERLRLRPSPRFLGEFGWEQIQHRKGKLVTVREQYLVLPVPTVREALSTQLKARRYSITYRGESWECGHLVACSSCPLFISSVRRADSRRHRAGSSLFDQMFGLRVLLPSLDTPLQRSLSNRGQEFWAGHSWDCLFGGKQKMTVVICFLSIL
ncbi:Collagen alpha-1(XXVIII) chain [Microtus ochrogaster]|uniref:Collagen alpha-1(XXVIII) chain n=1 Tax=Microtus ochrogaster TaxID=79684 RepID=A0A8J6GQ93_MICOH|nr:Collagen alpha-1(XXVIII) chain [Microtus ochrogaster]